MEDIWWGYNPVVFRMDTNHVKELLPRPQGNMSMSECLASSESSQLVPYGPITAY